MVFIKKKPLVKIEFDYLIKNQNNELLCEANTTLAFINMKTKKPMKCPDEILSKMGF